MKTHEDYLHEHPYYPSAPQYYRVPNGTEDDPYNQPKAIGDGEWMIDYTHDALREVNDVFYSGSAINEITLNGHLVKFGRSVTINGINHGFNGHGGRMPIKFIVKPI